MAEYIKREDAKKAILEACGCDYRCMVGCNGMCDIHAGSVWGAVDNIPNADVRENVRGEWKVMIENETFAECKCTNCGAVEYFNHGWKKFNFCPNCGAYMRDKNNDG